jgi:hypothetical protein
MCLEVIGYTGVNIDGKNYGVRVCVSEVICKWLLEELSMQTGVLL